ncbi:MAG: RagB/SusD family nutrient uptake outer membrane protein, partial [Prevotella sp.]|nr:RagB/SusD family nutrient uptake outer membrane protein [Prevotella sp.]
LIRMTDAYYIAAECLKNSNKKRAIEILNIVRDHRNLGLFPLSEDLTADQIQNEIYKEYRKEYIGEHGELFFYYKRTNASEIKGAAVRPGKSVYVLPIPSNDQEFGGYSN